MFFPAVKKKRLEEKKRRHPESHAGATDKVKKKQKVYSPLTENDKSVLEHWNKIQLASFNNPGGRRLVSKGEVEEQYKQELLIQQQSEQLDKQQKQIIEQQRRIQQQAEQIKLLVHQQKILIRECKASGIKIPLSTPTPSPIITPPQLASTSTATSLPLAVSKEVQGQTNSQQQSQEHTRQQPQQALLQKQEQAKPEQQRDGIAVCSIGGPPSHNVSSSLSNHSLSYSLPPPTQNSLNLEPSSNASLQQVTYPPPIAPPYAPPTDNNYPMPLMQSTSLEYTMAPPTYGGGHNSLPVVPPPPTNSSAVQYLPPSNDFFAPLTSKELMELTSQEVRKLSPFAPQSFGSFVPPLPEDFDNFFNLPNGCGAGYGVGVPDDELQVSIPESTDK